MINNNKSSRENNEMNTSIDIILYGMMKLSIIYIVLLCLKIQLIVIFATLIE